MFIFFYPFRPLANGSVVHSVAEEEKVPMCPQPERTVELSPVSRPTLSLEDIEASEDCRKPPSPLAGAMLAPEPTFGENLAKPRKLHQTNSVRFEEPLESAGEPDNQHFLAKSSSGAEASRRRWKDAYRRVCEDLGVKVRLLMESNWTLPEAIPLGFDHFGNGEICANLQVRYSIG